MKTLFLETCDGNTFVQICAEILQNAGYGSTRIVSATRNTGKNIIVTTPEDGIIFVKCTHRPNSTIGLPVVQKFHSVMVTSNVHEGMIITTGRFSPNALSYIEENQLHIDLIDCLKFIAIARKTGVNLILEGQQSTITIMTYPLPSVSFMQSQFLKYLGSHYTSSPCSINNLVTFSQLQALLYPLYELNYDIDATFTTSTGRVVHQEKSENATLCIDGKTGEEFDNPVYAHYSQISPQIYSPEFNNTWSLITPSFSIDQTSLDKIIAKIIIDRHSSSIGYIGRNNVYYSKSCIPSKHEFQAYNILPTYLPIMKVDLNIKQMLYSISEAYYTHDKILFSPVLNTCAVCGKYVNHGYICNECGSTVHQQTLLDSHGFICKQCGKTLCRACTYTLGFRNYVCKDCAQRSGKPYKHIPSSMREKYLVSGGVLTLVLITSFFVPISLVAKISIILITIISLLAFMSDSTSGVQGNKLDKINLKI